MGVGIAVQPPHYPCRKVFLPGEGYQGVEVTSTVRVVNQGGSAYDPYPGLLTCECRASPSLARVIKLDLDDWSTRHTLTQEY